MKRDFSLLTGKHVDLLVCGGGIYGAWTAYDAALRGLNVAIIEQGDWASATSSASSKLIHGGLRYLETNDFRLVRKAILERQRLLELAPHRVWPLRFGVPIYKDSRIGTFKLKAGLTLYDFFAGFPGVEFAHRHFNRDVFAKHFPALEDDGLKGGFTYGDAQTDDARLVLELIAGAMAAGAVCVNYCQMTRLIESGGQVCGAMVLDRLSNNSSQILARQIVYATGQWMSASLPGREWCRLSKGVHLVLPKILQEEALLLTAKSDGRVFFLIPWYGMTLLGTTDNDYKGDIENVAVEKKDIAYLLAEANHYLKTSWTEADIVGKYAGVRVMKRSDKASPSDVSRDWELKTAGNGVHYSIGGKITSAREDAASIIDSVCAQLGVDAQCATKSRPFPWTPEASFTQWFVALNARTSQLGIDHESANWLIRRHGKRVDEILLSVSSEPRLAERIVPTLPFIYADLLFCARNEMAIHLDDLLRRRMPLLILSRLDENKLRRIADTVAKVMDWDESELERQMVACRE
jgi:glycerol-3-phosphate dehydrogenase